MDASQLGVSRPGSKRIEDDPSTRSSTWLRLTPKRATLTAAQAAHRTARQSAAGDMTAHCQVRLVATATTAQLRAPGL